VRRLWERLIGKLYGLIAEFDDAMVEDL